MSWSGSLMVVNDRMLMEAIGRAKRRLVVVAPALSKNVAIRLAQRWRELGSQAVTVVVDTSADVLRLGYGDVESLALLEQAGRDAGGMLNRHDGVRVGLLVTDDTTFVYSPVPRLIEAGTDETIATLKVRPNGILVGRPSEELLKDLGFGAAGEVARVIGVDKATRAGIAAVTDELKQNPPQRFDISRLVIAFNAQFEFVEFKLKGAMIGRKTVQLPNVLLGIADEQTQQRLRTTFRLVSVEDKVTGWHLTEERAQIVRKYLRSIPQYGSIILRSDKEAFLKEVDELRKKVNAFKEAVLESLRQAMVKHREELKKALLPGLLKSPPKQWEYLSVRKPDEVGLGMFIDKKLKKAFGTAEEVVAAMEVEVLFKGVTCESLMSKSFLNKVREVVPEIDKLIEIREVAPSVSEENLIAKEAV